MKVFMFITMLFLVACGQEVQPKTDDTQNDPILAVVVKEEAPKETQAAYSVEEDVLWMIEQSKCRGDKTTALSEPSKKVLAKQVDRILNAGGGSPFTKQAFVFLLCKESQFRHNAKSPANAFGLTQMIMGTAQMEADKLGLGKLVPEDLYNTETSLLLGYNHFLYLEKQFNGNLSRMSGAYNGGEAGKTVKSLKTGGLGIHESDSYVASFFDAMEERRIAKEQKSLAGK